MKLLLVGPPGAGKGTISSFLMENYGVTHISTGEVLRRAIDEGTELGKLADALISKGEFVPDEIAVGIVKEALDGLDHYVLDGFPRNLAQASIFDEMLKESLETIDAVIALELEDEIILSRLKHRRECSKCKKTYHLIAMPPKKEGSCDDCGANLNLRKDDANVEKRLETYRNVTQPVIGHYIKQGNVSTIYTGKTISEIQEEVKHIINEKK
jgi:adenylate kinase